MKRLLIILSLIVVMVGALFWSQVHTGPFLISGFIESHQIRVGSRVGGRVKQVHVAEGQAVAVNEPLIELEPYDLRERLAEAQAMLNANKSTLEKLVAGPRKDEIEGARAARNRAQAAHDEAVAGPRASRTTDRRSSMSLSAVRRCPSSRASSVTPISWPVPSVSSWSPEAGGRGPRKAATEMSDSKGSAGRPTPAESPIRPSPAETSRFDRDVRVRCQPGAGGGRRTKGKLAPEQRVAELRDAPQSRVD